MMDQRATQAILKKALARLEEFYKKKALLQVRAGWRCGHCEQDQKRPEGCGICTREHSMKGVESFGALRSYVPRSLRVQAEPGAAVAPPPIGDEGMGEYKANQGHPLRRGGGVYGAAALPLPGADSQLLPVGQLCRGTLMCF